jgi:cell division protein FtsB
MQLQSRQYEFINDGKADVGLIAEEVYDVIPELVGKDSEDKPMSVSYDRFVSVLIKAVQELSAKNDALEARIKTLEDA